MRWVTAAALFFLGLLQNWHHWVFEFLRTFVFYDPASHMLKDAIAGTSPAMLVDYGVTIALVVGGAAILWPTRPEFFRRGHLSVFLERDSASNQYGIQTFSGITYIQCSVTTDVSLTKCQVWSSRVDYSPDGLAPFAIEHGERYPLRWSKIGGNDPFIAELHSGEPPVRVNVAIFNGGCIQFETEIKTPENLLNNFQRHGIHRVTLGFRALRGTNSISKTVPIFIRWDGVGAIVSLEGPRS